jgi:hypothetical protein
MLNNKRTKTNRPTKYQASQLRLHGTSYNNHDEYYRGLATRLTKKWFNNNTITNKGE